MGQGHILYADKPGLQVALKRPGVYVLDLEFRRLYFPGIVPVFPLIQQVPVQFLLHLHIRAARAEIRNTIGQIGTATPLELHMNDIPVPIAQIFNHGVNYHTPQGGVASELRTSRFRTVILTTLQGLHFEQCPFYAHTVLV